METPRVLIADDSPAIIRVLEMALREHNRVTGFTSASAAHEAGLTDEWHLALVDVSMPTMSGLEMAADWRGKGRVFPVVVLSGHDAPERGVPEGITAWVVKPFDPVTIRAIVERHATAPV